MHNLRCCAVQTLLGLIFKSYLPHKKGQKKNEQRDENETPMRQVLRVAYNLGNSPNRESIFSLPDIQRRGEARNTWKDMRSGAERKSAHTREKVLTLGAKKYSH